MFVGRTKELDSLRRWQMEAHPRRSQISAVYGRRRIGKTRLVEQAAKGTRFFKFEGLEGEDEAAQRAHFTHTLFGYSANLAHKLFRSDNWIDHLQLLSAFLGDEPAIVFFDEFQWMAAEKPDLVSRLKYAWDNFFDKHNQVHLILCGSISSFIVKKVINSKALYGRIDHILHLKAMSVQELGNAFLRDRSTTDHLDYYLCVGGVPKYFELYDRSKSVRLNLQSLCFTQDAYFNNELERLFVSHFGKSAHYRQVIENLALKRFAKREDIIAQTSLSPGGRASVVLDELELGDFIESYGPVHNSDSRILKRYRIVDYFLRFYYAFIHPIKQQIGPNTLPLHRALPDQKYAIWRGLAFEHYCRQNAATIARILGFSAVRYQCGAWFRRAEMRSGAQVDLIFTRADGVITLCEVKYSESLGTDVFRQTQRKTQALLDSPLNKGKDFTIEKVLVTALPAPKAVIEEGYFSRIITLDELLDDRITTS